VCVGESCFCDRRPNFAAKDTTKFLFDMDFGFFYDVNERIRQIRNRRRPVCKFVCKLAMYSNIQIFKCSGKQPSKSSGKQAQSPGATS